MRRHVGSRWRQAVAGTNAITTRSQVEATGRRHRGLRLRLERLNKYRTWRLKHGVPTRGAQLTGTKREAHGLGDMHGQDGACGSEHGWDNAEHNRRASQPHGVSHGGEGLDKRSKNFMCGCLSCKGKFLLRALKAVHTVSLWLRLLQRAR